AEIRRGGRKLFAVETADNPIAVGGENFARAVLINRRNVSAPQAVRLCKRSKSARYKLENAAQTRQPEIAVRVFGDVGHKLTESVFSPEISEFFPVENGQTIVGRHPDSS